MTTLKQQLLETFDQYDGEFSTAIYARLFNCSQRAVQAARQEWHERQAARQDAREMPELTKCNLPLRTLSGVMWTEPVKPPLSSNPGRLGVCTRCEYVERCRDATARGDFVACERPIERELI